MQKYNRVSILAKEVAERIGGAGGGSLALELQKHLPNEMKSFLQKVAQNQDYNPSVQAIAKMAKSLIVSGANAAGVSISDEHLEELLLRLRQFLIENYVVVPGLAKAIECRNLNKISKLTALSQELAESHLENQVEQTSFLAKSAKNFGAIAASGFGAGFGGSVWALVSEDISRNFMRDWKESYVSSFRGDADSCEFFPFRPQHGARELHI